MSSKNAILFFSIFAIVLVGTLGLFLIKKVVGPKISDSVSATSTPATSNTVLIGESRTNQTGPKIADTEKPADSKSFLSSLFNFNFDFFSFDTLPDVSVGSSGTGNSDNINQNGEKSPEQIANDLENAQKEAEKIQKDLEEIQAEQNASPLKGKIKISSVNRGYSYSGSGSATASEYVTIRAENTNSEPVRLTGLRLESKTSGQGDEIGDGVVLPFANTTNPTQAIELKPGEIAYVVTGRSPIGYSFRVNKCSGYFEQFQDFSPSIQYDCPALNDEPKPESPNALPDACLDYIQYFPRCQIRTGTPPQNVTESCVAFVDNHIGYNYCILNHKGDIGFAKNEWRIYLSRDNTLWKDRRETVELLDQNRKVIDSYSY